MTMSHSHQDPTLGFGKSLGLWHDLRTRDQLQSESLCNHGEHQDTFHLRKRFTNADTRTSTKREVGAFG